jgi:hypothetical protein
MYGLMDIGPGKDKTANEEQLLGIALVVINKLEPQPTK